MRKRYSDEFLIRKLKDYSSRLKRTPNYEEYERDRGVPSATLYKKRFGSWNNALELADLEKNAIRKYSRENIVNDALRFYEANKRSPYYYELSYSIVIIRKYWSGWRDFVIDIGLPLNLSYSKITTKNELIIFLENLYETLGEIPNSSDVTEAGVGRHLI